jgi:MSHA pilin protein MshC
MPTARGYTLIEMIAVLMVAGIVAAMALPALTDRSALQARGFADALRAMLRHCRATATAQQRDVCVQVSPLQARALLTCNPATPLATPGESAPFVIDVPAGLALSGTLVLRFNASGQPVPNATQVLNAGTHPITVYRETGLVQ